MSNRQRASTLNAISPTQPTDADERTTRHLRMCAELADLGMELARAAAARTRANLVEPEEHPASHTQFTPAPDAQSDPETARAANPAPAAASCRAATAASHKQTDPAILFTRFAAIVRDCIALEARLAAGSPHTTRAGSLALRADPRRALLRHAFHRTLENHPDRAVLLRETTTCLDEDLAADAEQTAHPAHLFANICNELGIEFDVAILPDELLGADLVTTYAREDRHNAPGYRATSPP